MILCNVELYDLWNVELEIDTIKKHCSILIGGMTMGWWNGIKEISGNLEASISSNRAQDFSRLL